MSYLLSGAIVDTKIFIRSLIYTSSMFNFGMDCMFELDKFEVS